jgi:hypothetical protein
MCGTIFRAPREDLAWAASPSADSCDGWSSLHHLQLGLKTPPKLSGKTLAGIYSSDIISWQTSKGRNPSRDFAPAFPSFRRSGSVPGSQLILDEAIHSSSARVSRTLPPSQLYEFIRRPSRASLPILLLVIDLLSPLGRFLFRSYLRGDGAKESCRT